MVVEPLMPIIDAAVVSIANITRKELLTATVDTHQEILNGVLDQDPQAARAAVALHLEMNRIVIKHAKSGQRKQNNIWESCFGMCDSETAFFFAKVIG